MQLIHTELIHDQKVKKMKKSLIIAILSFFALGAEAQASQGYVVISWSTSTQQGGFDCVTNKQSRIISTPIAVPDIDEMVKYSLTYQFLNWAYINEKVNLDKVAGFSYVHFKSIDYAKTIDKVQSDVKRAGYYNDTTASCGLVGNDHIEINVVDGFKYQDGDVDSIIGGAERREMLNSYFNAK